MGGCCQCHKALAHPLFINHFILMKKRFNISRCLPLMALTICFMLAGCFHHGIKVRSARGALAVCQAELMELKFKKSASIDELIEYINQTQEMEDSIMSFSIKDTATAANAPLQDSILVICDSLRQEITRLALSEQRSLSDVVFIKTNTVKGQMMFIDAKCQKQADRFYAKLDNNSTYKDLKTTLKEYDRILSNDDYLHISSREIFRDFLKKEDICFRSLLQFLPLVPQEKLTELTEETARICNTFYTSSDNSFAPIEEITMYMTMRYNRRILQNAEACRDQIMNGLKLNPTIARNYRWMLMQPYFSIDELSIAAMSSGQQQLMRDIAQDMPELYSKLDKFDPQKDDSKLKFLDKISTYILKSHIKNVI